MWLLAGLAVAAPQFPVQGTIADASGAPAQGTREVAFALYAAESGGSSLWTEEQAVAFIDGAFNAHLGAVSPISPTILDDEALFLGVAIDGGPESTRVPVGFAPRAAWAVEAGDAARLGTHPAADFWLKSEDIAWTSLDGTLHEGARTGYAAGSGLTLTGTTFAATPYAAGAGLTLTGTTFSAAATAFVPGSGLSLSGTTLSALPYTGAAPVTLTGTGSRTIGLDPAGLDTLVRDRLDDTDLTVGGAVGLGTTSITGTACTGNGRIAWDGKAFRGCVAGAWRFLGGVADGATRQSPGVSCKDLKADGVTTSGPRWIWSGTGAVVQVYCDMTVDNGGWTLVAKARGTWHDPDGFMKADVRTAELPYLGGVDLSGTYASIDTRRLAVENATEVRLSNYALTRWVKAPMHTGRIVSKIWDPRHGQGAIAAEASANSQAVTATAWNGTTATCYVNQYGVMAFNAHGASFPAFTTNTAGNTATGDLCMGVGTTTSTVYGFTSGATHNGQDAPSSEADWPNAAYNAGGFAGSVWLR